MYDSTPPLGRHDREGRIVLVLHMVPWFCSRRWYKSKFFRTSFLCYPPRSSRTEKEVARCSPKSWGSQQQSNHGVKVGSLNKFTGETVALLPTHSFISLAFRCQKNLSSGHTCSLTAQFWPTKYSSTVAGMGIRNSIVFIASRPGNSHKNILCISYYTQIY